MIKIFSADEYTAVDMLIFALEYVHKNIPCDIINISLGTSIPDQRLQNICQDIYNSGTIIISAFSNDGCMSYPAAYSQVIGIDISIDCQTKDSYIYVCDSPVNIIAMGCNHRLAWTEPRYTIRQGASFSAPYITALIFRWLQEGLPADECAEKLKNCAKKVLYNKTISSNNDAVIMVEKRLALFPYNKEMHSIVNFSDMLKGTITGIYDIKYLRNCSKIVENFAKSESFCIRNIDNIDWDSFDCLVIGHVDEIQKHIGNEIKTNLLHECLSHGKSVFCFDDKGLEDFPVRFKEKGLSLMTPVKKCFLPQKGGRLYMIKSPVVGIMGTSNKQCKFTLQLLIRKELQRREYIVGQLGTEPGSALFGIDDTIHFGYSGTIHEVGEPFVEYINSRIHEIDNKNPDIIVVGNQAGTIPRYAYNISHLRIPELEFLIASNPDAVILCVNLYDDFEYIRRSIQAIENIIDTKVILLAISPMTYPNDWYLMNEKKKLAASDQISTFANSLETEFGIPAYPILPDGNEVRIVDCLLGFFGG